MTGNGDIALAPIGAALREEVQKPEYWKKWKQGWDTTELLLKEPPETQAEFVIAMVRRTLKPEEKPVDVLGALENFFSRVITGQPAHVGTLVVSPRTIPLDQMSETERELYITDLVNYAATGALKELVRSRVPLSEAQVVQLLELYIVPGRSIDSSGGKASHRIFLPFEGDGMLAIILSKAFLLVEGTKITDRTILRQLPS